MSLGPRAFTALIVRPLVALSMSSSPLAGPWAT